MLSGTTFIKKWYCWFILLLIIGAYWINLFLVTKDLKQIPTCLYGCDYYHENGAVLDLINNPSQTWQSGSHGYLGLPQTTPKFYFYLRMVFSKLFGLDFFESWKVVLPLSYIFIAVGLGGWFLLYRKIFTGEIIALLLAVLTFEYTNAPYFKYNAIMNVLTPYLLLHMLVFFERLRLIESYRNLWDKKFILISLSLMIFFIVYAHIHAMAPFIMYLFFFFGFFFFGGISKQSWKLKTLIALLMVLLTLVVILSLGWWREIIFTYGDAINAKKFDVHVDLTKSANYWRYTPIYLGRIFSFNGWLPTVLTLSLVTGLIFLFFMKKSNLRQYGLWIFLSVMALIFHYLLTVPLFHKHLSTGHMIPFLLMFFKAIFLGLLLTILSQVRLSSLEGKWIVRGIAVILIVIVFLTNLNALQNLRKDRFFQIGYQELPPNYKVLQEFVQQEKIDSTNMLILSTNELSFALHGLLGAKLITGRQSHFFMFGDFQNYWMDAAIILYGNNSLAREQLLREYARYGLPMYLYWDEYWFNSEYLINDKGQLVGFYDPLRFEYSEERQRILDLAGITYLVREGIFEPSAQNNPDAVRLQIMYLTPDNYHNFTQPWNPDLNNYLTEVWSYESNGRPVAKLYVINLP
ncbi:hypothetical protein HYW21_01440 [Candidatus Woesearchaeota archaeon]|nr:hypothetical protein [Candidatus Woesearchaeota archaeon]